MLRTNLLICATRLLDLAQPPTLDQMLLYADPIPTNSGTADLAGCVELNPQ